MRVARRKVIVITQKRKPYDHDNIIPCPTVSSDAAQSHLRSRYRTELSLMRVHAVCDAAHCRAGPLHVKD